MSSFYICQEWTIQKFIFSLSLHWHFFTLQAICRQLFCLYVLTLNTLFTVLFGRLDMSIYFPLSFVKTHHTSVFCIICRTGKRPDRFTYLLTFFLIHLWMVTNLTQTAATDKRCACKCITHHTSRDESFTWHPFLKQYWCINYSLV